MLAQRVVVSCWLRVAAVRGAVCNCFFFGGVRCVWLLLTVVGVGLLCVVLRATFLGCVCVAVAACCLVVRDV